MIKERLFGLVLLVAASTLALLCGCQRSVTARNKLPDATMLSPFASEGFAKGPKISVREADCLFRSPTPELALVKPRTLNNTALSPIVSDVGPQDVAMDNELLKALQMRPDYVLGPGDAIRVTVFGDQLITGNYVLGPDGKVALPLAGVLRMGGLTREKSADLVAENIKSKIEKPAVTVDVTKYANNHVYVLGRVEKPGYIELMGEGRLLQVLAGGGAVATNAETALPSRCAIIRGNDKIIWVDLRQLMQGELSLNLPLQNNDVVFLPESAQEMVYVLGAVQKSGAYPARVGATLVDAIAHAGGITEDGRLGHVLVAHKGSDKEPCTVAEYDLRKLLEKGDMRTNPKLHAGDVVYVRPSSMSKVGLFFRRVAPGIQLLSVGANLFDTFKRGSAVDVRRTQP